MQYYYVSSHTFWWVYINVSEKRLYDTLFLGKSYPKLARIILVKVRVTRFKWIKMERKITKYSRSLSDAHILIVDDEEINCEIMKSMLGDFYQVSTVSSGEAAIEFCSKQKPDLILLDVMLGGMSGIDSCRALKSTEETLQIPIIFITGLDKEEQQNACWDAGAVDFVTKPVNGTELRNRVRAHLTHKLQTDLLLSLTYVDRLTGVYNRHYLDNVLPKLTKQAQRDGSSVSVLMIDIDWFKLYNDHYGHLQGDNCLVQVADIITEVLQRPSDVLIRFGGEEFIGLLVDTDLSGAQHVAELIIARLKVAKIPHQKSLFEQISVSIGCAVFNGSESENLLSDVIKLADHQLYEAKAKGRNQVKA